MLKYQVVPINFHNRLQLHPAIQGFWPNTIRQMRERQLSPSTSVEVISIITPSNCDKFMHAPTDLGR